MKNRTPLHDEEPQPFTRWRTTLLYTMKNHTPLHDEEPHPFTRWRTTPALHDEEPHPFTRWITTSLYTMKDHNPLHDEIREGHALLQGGGRLQRDTENTMTAFKKSSSPDLWGHYFLRNQPPLGEKKIHFLLIKDHSFDWKGDSDFFFFQLICWYIHSLVYRYM